MYYEHKELGYNYRIGPINAAVGLSKIDRLESEISQRRGCFEAYNQALNKDGFHFQLESPGNFSNRWLSTLCLRNNKDVELLSKTLLDQGIETRRVWNPMHLQPVFKDAPFYSSSTYPSPLEKGRDEVKDSHSSRSRFGTGWDEVISETLFENGLCLPSGSNLSPADLQRIVTLIKQQFSK